MLLEFKFKNFKSFKEETILDLTATKQTELNSHIRNISNEKVLPVATIFGANASGKSNVFEAFDYMSKYVYRSFGYGDSGLIQNIKNNFVPPNPYVFDKDSVDEESLFEVYFVNQLINDDKIYNYGFTVDKNGINKEWLKTKARTERREFRIIFSRNKDDIDLQGIKAPQKENLLASLGSQTLIVSLGSKLKIDICDNVYKWFVFALCINFANPYEVKSCEDSIKNFLLEHKDKHTEVVEYVNTFDNGIIGFRTNYIVSNNGKKIPIIKTLHKMNDSNDIVEIPFEQESSGTRKMISMYNWMDIILSKGGLIFIDDLNVRLHPLLIRNIIQTFTDPEKNIKNAQLIFTTHDAWQLDNGGLRRDEIWFTEKDDEGKSELFSLADFIDEDGSKIRKEENYEKNYMLGKYGAIPNIKVFYYSSKEQKKK